MLVTIVLTIVFLGAVVGVSVAAEVLLAVAGIEENHDRYWG